MRGRERKRRQFRVESLEGRATPSATLLCFEAGGGVEFFAVLTPGTGLGGTGLAFGSTAGYFESGMRARTQCPASPNVFEL